MLNKKALAGTAGAPKLYVEDVYSTYLYAGNGSTQTITNNIDLSTEGGLVWIKDRTTAYDHQLYDTVRGANKTIRSNLTNAEQTYTTALTSFNTNGFSLGSQITSNNSGDNFVSFSFRKAKKFFDIVTWTGTGSTGAISRNHNLGSTPGCIIVKAVSTTEGQWYVYHRSLGVDKVISLNLTNAADSVGSPDAWAVTSTTFSINTSQIGMNTNGTTYIAYLFAHDAGGFGDAGSDSIIKCGSFSTDGSGNATVDLGWEPQWVLYKRSDSSTGGNWIIVDNMRGFTANASSNDNVLFPNLSDAETNTTGIQPNATGFSITGGGFASRTYIYIAIRRGPMKTPTSGTSVFDVQTAGVNTNIFSTLDGVDFAFAKAKNGNSGTGSIQNGQFVDRLRGMTQIASNTIGAVATNTPVLLPTSTNAEATSLSAVGLGRAGTSDSQMRAMIIGRNGNDSNVLYALRRAPGFFDVVCYTGTGSAGQTYNHNLGVVPELIIVKRRSDISDWSVYSSTVGATGYLLLNTTDASVTGVTTRWNNTAPTSTVFSTGTSSTVNGSGSTYVAYLFASCPGVSKVGTYTGNGSSVTVTTDFQPRFILVKRTDSTGDWLVSDSARGLVAGNDPYLELNTTDAEVTNEDWVDISSTSFTVNQTTNNANVNTGTYIYLCIA